MNCLSISRMHHGVASRRNSWQLCRVPNRRNFCRLRPLFASSPDMIRNLSNRISARHLILLSMAPAPKNWFPIEHTLLLLRVIAFDSPADRDRGSFPGEQLFLPLLLH